MRCESLEDRHLLAVDLTPMMAGAVDFVGTVYAENTAVYGPNWQPPQAPGYINPPNPGNFTRPDPNGETDVQSQLPEINVTVLCEGEIDHENDKLRV